MSERPKVNSAGQKELDKVQEQFDAFDAQAKALTLDEANKAPIADFEPQTKISNREIAAQTIPYIKPSRSMSSKEGFNEKYRAAWEQDKKYVKCIAENNECIGDGIEMWTKPYAGVPAEFWKIPVNKPIAVPGYVANQLTRCNYHKLVMDEGKTTASDGYGSYYGAMAVKETVRRLDARPVGNAFVAMGS